MAWEAVLGLAGGLGRVGLTSLLMSTPQMELKALKQQLELERQAWEASCARKEVGAWAPRWAGVGGCPRWALLPWHPGVSFLGVTSGYLGLSSELTLVCCFQPTFCVGSGRIKGAWGASSMV